jgi:hypothetical protein
VSSNIRTSNTVKKYKTVLSTKLFSSILQNKTSVQETQLPKRHYKYYFVNRVVPKIKNMIPLTNMIPFKSNHKGTIPDHNYKPSIAFVADFNFGKINLSKTDVKIEVVNRITCKSKVRTWLTSVRWLPGKNILRIVGVSDKVGTRLERLKFQHPFKVYLHPIQWS